MQMTMTRAMRAARRYRIEHSRRSRRVDNEVVAGDDEQSVLDVDCSDEHDIAATGVSEEA